MKNQLTLMTFLLLMILSACTVNNSIERNTSNEIASNSRVLSSGLIHTVYFWYKDDVDPNKIASFVDELKLLGEIKSVDRFYYGPPAKTLERARVDHSYDMCVNIFFKDVAAHDAYQIDPIHVNFVEKCKDLWEKVIVYDNEIK